MDSKQIEQIANQLAEIAAVFSPQNAAAIGALVAAGTQLNNMIKEIRENSPDVWQKISQQYSDAVDAFNQSVLDSNMDQNRAGVEP